MSAESRLAAGGGGTSSGGWREAGARGLRLAPLDVLWLGFALAMLFVMWNSQSGMTVPYHFIFITFALVYGFRMWSKWLSVLLLAGITVATAVVFLHAYSQGRVQLDELAEIPLMPMIVGFAVFHGLRAEAARRRVEEYAAQEAGQLNRQREFLRDTSHAIRTPVTIARGHVELLHMHSTDAQTVADADEIRHQLDRITALAGRLLAIEQLQTVDRLDIEVVDVQSFVSTLGRRWAAAVERDWRVTAEPAGLVETDPHRLAEALDALVENALRFTTAKDRIRLSCRREGPWTVIEVADSGPGIPPEDRERVFERFFQRHPRGEEPGTGLGLALVHAVAAAHRGQARALSAPEGGALLQLRLPHLGVAEDAGSPAIPLQATGPVAPTPAGPGPQGSTGGW